MIIPTLNSKEIFAENLSAFTQIRLLTSIENTMQ